MEKKLIFTSFKKYVILYIILQIFFHVNIFKKYQLKDKVDRRISRTARSGRVRTRVKKLEIAETD